MVTDRIASTEAITNQTNEKMGSNAACKKSAAIEKLNLKIENSNILPY